MFGVQRTADDVGPVGAVYVSESVVDCIARRTTAGILTGILMYWCLIVRNFKLQCIFCPKSVAANAGS
jgi:hypothetical protein